MAKPIIIAAGGTGGHLFPAEALAAELIRRGERVALMTDARSAAYDSPVFANAERFVLRGSGLSGRGVRQALRGASALFMGTLEARRHIRDLSPSAVVGFGGYPSFPPLAAARLMRASRRPALILHEQNAVLVPIFWRFPMPIPRWFLKARKAPWWAIRCDLHSRHWRGSPIRYRLKRRRCAFWCWVDRWARGFSPMLCRRRSVPCPKPCACACW
jgi:UDP-N-acetylglucosamine:LPS N-acetylglucosamine transferase